MAMNLGPGAEGGEPDLMLEINTTPLIDVMLVLLVMLIITIPIQLHAVDLVLPGVKAPPSPVPPQVVRIDVEADGSVVWNGERLPDRAALEARLAGQAAAPVQAQMQLRPNRLAPYANVAAVLASAQRVGLKKIGISGID